MSDKIADQVLKDNALKLDGNKNKSTAKDTGSGAGMQGLLDSQKLRMNKGVNDGQ